MYTPTIL